MTRFDTNSASEILLSETTERQRRAADPDASVWVSANAGTGKTHVLTTRVLRLLLSGTKPEQILCVTYTKAAAALMSQRIFAQLAKWVMAPDDELARLLANLTGEAVSQAQRDFARTLFTTAIETPGGLKIQTIHGFCERLLQRFPLEAGIAPGFRILDDKQSQTLVRESVDRVLVAATARPDQRLGRALNAAIAYAGDGYFDEILAEALRHRTWLRDMHKLNNRASNGVHGGTTQKVLKDHFGLSDTDTASQVLQCLDAVMSDEDFRRAQDALRTGSANDLKTANRIDAVLRASSEEQRAIAIVDVFLTQKKTPHKSLMTQKVATANADILATMESAQATTLTLYQKLVACRILDATAALNVIADAVMQTYTRAKRRQSALDFDDLIDHSVDVLTGGTDAQWVLYKLDEGLSHVLVDESQDTSPKQWQLIQALSQEFYTGHGRSEATRTVFAVGDEKQSIFSFQGAAPREFARQGEKFEALAANSGQSWHRVPLTMSFRTTEPVLHTVDRVFADPSRTPGLSSSAEALEHRAFRIGQAGSVELWPVETKSEAAASDPWLPLGDEDRGDPVEALADRIAATVSYWIENGETLASTGKAISPGDILILVRKRKPFAAAMVAALKARGIPVSGADRIQLLEQIAICDVLSLADFLTLPEDDLSLAEVLKSPIFGFDDNDLLALAPDRGLKTLWKALLDNEPGQARYHAAAETLKRWRRIADFAPPYEFFARLFDTDKVREKLLSRLGLDAGEALDEFIDLTLQFDEQEPPSLSGFLTWLRANGHEVKRDLEMTRNEVRVMTVHGAKGLEAPIVFLPDTCSAAAGGKGKAVISVPGVRRPDGIAAPILWAVKDSGDHPTVQQAKSAQKRLEQEESHRLLYVAMTRARDRLFVGGFERGPSGIAGDSWYTLIANSLEGTLVDGEDQLGRPVKRLSSRQTADLETPDRDSILAAAAVEPPPWANQQAPREPLISIPLAPSKLAPFEIDDDGEPLAEQPAPDRAEPPQSIGPPAPGDNAKFARGNVTHALLQHLPNFAEAERESIAKRFVDLRGSDLSPTVRQSIVAETMQILTDPTFAPLFGPQSRAEVPIVATLASPTGSGPSLHLNGAIDRLADLGDALFVVDFKTNRRPPATQDEVADAYLYQLASYRLALNHVYGGKPVRAALLWTEGPVIMEIPPAKLEAYENRLWQLKDLDLDAHWHRT